MNGETDLWPAGGQRSQPRGFGTLSALRPRGGEVAGWEGGMKPGRAVLSLRLQLQSIRRSMETRSRRLQREAALLRWSVLHEPRFHTRQGFCGEHLFLIFCVSGDPLRSCTKRFLFTFQEHKESHYDMWTHTFCTNSVVDIPKWDW